MEYGDIVKLLSNPDHVAEGLTELDAYAKDVSTKLATLTAQTESDATRIRELQDSNMKLYLRITGKEEHKEAEDTRDDFEKLIDKVKEKN